MAEPFLGEIRMLPYMFAPRYWAWCNGQTISIGQNTALYAVLGTIYGGDGYQTFKLPDLRSRTPIHSGTGVGLRPKVIGHFGGSSNIALDNSAIPEHNHNMYGVESNGEYNDSTYSYLSELVTTERGRTVEKNLYEETSDGDIMNTMSVGHSGDGQPHFNRQPFLSVNFCIALEGLFPPRS